LALLHLRQAGNADEAEVVERERRGAGRERQQDERPERAPPRLAHERDPVGVALRALLRALLEGLAAGMAAIHESASSPRRGRAGPRSGLEKRVAEKGRSSGISAG